MTLLPMENKESILCALKCFEKEKSANIPPILDDYIKQVAKNGQTMLPWIYVKPLMLCKYNKVMDSFHGEYSTEFLQVSPTAVSVAELRQRVYNTLKRLDGIPFTIQRLCELLENPFRHYTRPDKFLRGLEKVLMVVSTVDPQGNKIHREDPRFPSQAGMEECSMIINDTLMSPLSSPLIGNLRGQHVSKSSDEEVTEDENGDENEEEEEEEEEEEVDEDHDETDESNELNHLDRVPALDEENASDVSSPAKPVSSSVWYSGSKLTHVSTRKPRDSMDDQDDEQDNDQDEAKNATDGSGISPGTNYATSKSVHLSQKSGDPGTTKLADSDAHCTETVHDNMEHTGTDLRLDANKSTSEDMGDAEGRSSTLDTVPPIRQILRPIGQLEAFVQNMTTDVPNSGLSSSNSVPSNSAAVDMSQRDTSSATVTPIVEGGSNSQSTFESDEVSPCSAHKRSMSDSPLGVLSGTTSDSPSSTVDNALNSLVSPEALQSPAKRRRVGNTPGPNNTVSGSEATGPFPSSLNNSPPIIVCNPLSTPNRDRESGECLSISAVADETQSTTSTGVADSAESSGDVLNSSGTGTVRIDMETGEEEEELDQETTEPEAEQTAGDPVAIRDEEEEMESRPAATETTR